ncbi:MAG: hypothetical protein QNK37_19990 [Acidobacteriota bacterium]|nr:hypothetical protein [Acidobacteriota bacterium]
MVRLMKSGRFPSLIAMTCFLLFQSGCGVRLWAQRLPPAFEPVEQIGLSGADTTCILQDARGFLRLGTQK